MGRGGFVSMLPRGGGASAFDGGSSSGGGGAAGGLPPYLGTYKRLDHGGDAVGFAGARAAVRGPNTTVDADYMRPVLGATQARAAAA